MKKCRLLIFIVLSVPGITSQAQKKSPYSFRLGATVCFGLNKIAHNDVGVGGLAGAEKKLSNKFAAEVETAYNYFTGDKLMYNTGSNKAYTIPILAGIKAYPLSHIYASLRTGAMYFLLNDMNDAKFSFAYGVAGGINLPQKTNRMNLQLGYTFFQYQRITRGYATLAAAIIIN